MIYFTGPKNNTWKLRLEEKEKNRLDQKEKSPIVDTYLIINTITVILSF